MGKKNSRDESWREKIKAGVIMDRLIKHIEGKIEMTATQIAAAKIILAKVIPDLKSHEHKGEVTHHYVMALPEPEKTADAWKASLTETLQ